MLPTASGKVQDDRRRGKSPGQTPLGAVSPQSVPGVFHSRSTAGENGGKTANRTGCSAAHLGGADPPRAGRLPRGRPPPAPSHAPRSGARSCFLSHGHPENGLDGDAQCLQLARRGRAGQLREPQRASHDAGAGRPRPTQCGRHLGASAHNGTFPCLRAGTSGRLPARTERAWCSTRRVLAGSMTSSM